MSDITYTLLDDCIEIQNDGFDIKQILECGQVFRFEKRVFGYTVYSLSQKADIYCQKNTTKIFCKDKKYFVNYFDLDTNYDTIKSELKVVGNLYQEIEYGQGIRILRQDPIEMIVSFIISANNNIPRIKQIIQNICKNFGSEMGDYFAFPTLKQLEIITSDDFRNAGCGYRSEYLVDTIKRLKDINVYDLYHMPTPQAKEVLLSLKGVGNKVADCILLFGYGKTDVFPTDTWIVKAYQDKYGTNLSNPIEISKFFTKLYGKYSGYAQQYMFYAKRENKE